MLIVVLNEEMSIMRTIVVWMAMHAVATAEKNQSTPVSYSICKACITPRGVTTVQHVFLLSFSVAV